MISTQPNPLEVKQSAIQSVIQSEKEVCDGGVNSREIDLDQIAIDKLIQQNNFKIIQSKSVEEFEEIEERKITTIINQPIPKVTSLEKISKLLSRFKDKVASLPSIPDRKVITAEITRDLTRNLVDLKQFIQDVEIVNTSKSEISKIVSQTITESELTTTLDELCELDVISLDVPKVY